MALILQAGTKSRGPVSLWTIGNRAGLSHFTKWASMDRAMNVQDNRGWMHLLEHLYVPTRSAGDLLGQLNAAMEKHPPEDPVAAEVAGLFKVSLELLPEDTLVISIVDEYEEVNGGDPDDPDGEEAAADAKLEADLAEIDKLLDEPIED